MNRKKTPAQASKQEEEIQVVSVVATEATTMDITSEYKLPIYTPTEELMDNLKINAVDFASKIDSFKVDRITMDDVEDDICLQVAFKLLAVEAK